MQFYFQMVHFGEMDNMTEEQVTKKILAWLIENQWQIICFDFPQSGTGKYLHPNEEYRNSETKNYAAFIPDIVSVKEDKVVFFENKNRFFLDDFIKLKSIREKNIYSESINTLLSKYEVNNYYYGIGAVKTEAFVKKSLPYLSHVDFIILVDNDNIELHKNTCFELMPNK